MYYTLSCSTLTQRHHNFTVPALTFVHVDETKSLAADTGLSKGMYTHLIRPANDWNEKILGPGLEA